MNNMIFRAGNPVCSNSALIHRSGVVRPAGGVASFGRDGELHSPNPLRTRRNRTPASRLFCSCGSGIVSARLALTLKMPIWHL